MTHRRTWRRPVTVLIGILLCLTAFAVWQIESRFIFSRRFGEYRFGIEFGAEIDIDGVEHRLLNTSLYDPPALMYGVHPFRIPTKEAPEFKIVSFNEAGLHCVYDTLGWGYLAIIDTNANTYFCAEAKPYSGADTLDWQDRFELLRGRFPSIPYNDVFDRARKPHNDSVK